MGQTLHPYSVLRRVLMMAIAMLVAVPAIQAQQRQHELIRRADRTVKGSGYGLLTTARAVPMTVDMNAFRAVASSSLHLASVPVSADRSVDLELTEFSVIDNDTKLTYTDATGRHPIDRISVRTYKGTVKGEAGSEVFMAFADHSVVGMITTGGTTYQIATDFNTARRAGELAAFSVPSQDLPEQKFACGIKDQPFSKEELDALHGGERGLSSAAECPSILYALKGAFDADYEFYYEWHIEGGGRDGAISYMVSLVAAMSQIYERDAQVQIVISAMNIWTTPADPYTETANMPIALDEAQGIWGSYYGNVDRGFAQVFSAKEWNGIIGIANGFDLICNPAESITFQLVKKWDPIGSIAVLAHELGHLTGLRHTHSCTWQPHIDECASAESGNCFAGTTLTEGTIMSYCKQKLMKIHERQIPFLRNRVPSWISCLQEAKKLEISKTLLTYPVVNIGNPVDSTWPYYFVNHSKGDVTVDSMLLVGDIYNQFEILGPETPFVVASCDSVHLRLKFKAERDTTHRAQLLIFHDGLNVNYGQKQHFRVDVEAFAKDDRPSFGFANVGNNRINFGTLKVDDIVDTVFKNPKELFINIGTAPLRVDSSAILGPDRFEFEMTEGGAPFVLVPFQKRQATIRFTPKTPGNKQAWLKVWSNSPGNPEDSVELVAQVLRGPVLELKVGNAVIDFGEVYSERTYDTTFTDFFYNNGTEPLELNAGITGPDADLFPNTQWLDYLEPGEGLDLGFQFFAEDTVAHGWKRAFIVIASNTPRGFDTIQVTAKIVGSAAAPGSHEAETAAFMIVPNPTDGDAEISIAPAAGELGKEYTLRIVDAGGREVRTLTGRFTVDGIRTSLTKGDLPSGVYYVSVTTEKGMRSHAVTITR